MQRDDPKGECLRVEGRWSTLIRILSLTSE